MEQLLPAIIREKSYLRIVDCLEQGDAAAVRQAMYDHLADSRRDAGDEPVRFVKG